MTKPDSQTKQPAGRVLPLLLIMILAFAGFWWFAQQPKQEPVQQVEEASDDAVPKSPRESAAIVSQIERYKEQARASDEPAVQVEANVCAYSDTFVLGAHQPARRAHRLRHQ